MVRHGKGGKERVAAILDSSDGTELALQRLRKSQPEGYQFLFASTTPGRGTKWLADVPTSDEVVALVVGKTAKRAGLGKLAAHDLRRTLITIGLESGGHVERPARAGGSYERSHNAALCASFRCSQAPRENQITVCLRYETLRLCWCRDEETIPALR